MHAMAAEWSRSLVEDAPGLDRADREKCGFWVSQLMSSLSPNNFFWTNPGAVQRYLSSEGQSLEKGMANAVDDLQRQDQLTRLVDEASFRIGENIAATPGSVVFRNELLELIQYHPQTETCIQTPIVLIQPWINKYYIFDLSPHNSFVRYLVDQGFPVFITSWKNPTSDMHRVSFADYLFRGIQPAIEAARSICSASAVHAAGYCIGGTALASMMAWYNAGKDDVPIASWSLFSTLVDFSHPGTLGVFTDEAGIETTERLMAGSGYLDARYISLVFRLLKPESLIWRSAANNYLHGQPPPKSDMLFWNSDSTRLPERMCSEYLRDFYLSNRLSRPGELAYGHRPIDLGSIEQPAWIVGCEQDHISPWEGTHRTCGLLSCPVTYVLANEGHIVGIVNPPSARSRKKYRVGPSDHSLDAQAWRSKQEVRQGSWWPGWTEWLTERSEAWGEPPPVGNPSYPNLGPAPGTYVLES
jgi:polyhydroxyalkanoate synthase